MNWFYLTVTACQPAAAAGSSDEACDSSLTDIVVAEGAAGRPQTLVDLVGSPKSLDDFPGLYVGALAELPFLGIHPNTLTLGIHVRLTLCLTSWCPMLGTSLHAGVKCLTYSCCCLPCALCYSQTVYSLLCMLA